MFKQIVSSALILSQAGFAASALAQPTAPTPEFRLVRESIALAGQGLSPEEMKARVAEAFASYRKSAEPEGQVGRMEQALIDLNVYTPERAHQIVSDAQVFSSSNRITDQTAATEIALLSSQYPAGAQFSACNLSWIIGAGGGLTAIAGGFILGLGADANTDAYGNNIPDVKEEHLGEIMLGAGALAILDGVVIHMFSSDNSCD